MAHSSLHTGWFSRPGNSNDTSPCLAGLKGKPDEVSTSVPEDGTGNILSKDYFDIRSHVHDSILRRRYVDFEQLKLIDPSCDTRELKVDQFLGWTICWQKYRSMVLEVQPEREAELQQYGDSIEDLFLLIRPQFYSLVVELDKAERQRVGGPREDRKTLSYGAFPDDPVVPGEVKSEILHVQVRQREASLGGRALGASTTQRLIAIYSLKFWRTIAHSLFKLVTFSAFA